MSPESISCGPRARPFPAPINHREAPGPPPQSPQPNTTECRMKPLSQLPSREPGACGGGAGSRGREGVGSSGGWELVAPSGRPPPRIPAPEPHHGARKGELLFGEGEGCPGGSASLRRGKAGGEASGNSLGGRGRVLGAGRDPETLSGGHSSPRPGSSPLPPTDRRLKLGGGGQEGQAEVPGPEPGAAAGAGYRGLARSRVPLRVGLSGTGPSGLTGPARPPGARIGPRRSRREARQAHRTSSRKQELPAGGRRWRGRRTKGPAASC